MNNAGIFGLIVVGVIYLLAHLEEHSKKKRKGDGKYHPASPPIQQRGNYRNSEGSGYEDLAMRDKD